MIVWGHVGKLKFVAATCRYLMHALHNFISQHTPVANRFMGQTMLAIWLWQTLDHLRPLGNTHNEVSEFCKTVPLKGLLGNDVTTDQSSIGTPVNSDQQSTWTLLSVLNSVRKKFLMLMYYVGLLLNDLQFCSSRIAHWLSWKIILTLTIALSLLQKVAHP